MSILEITPDVITDLNQRMNRHTKVKDISVVVLTARELEGLLNIVKSALAQGKVCSCCQYYVPGTPRGYDTCSGCGV